MEPGEFIQVLDKNGQIPGMVAEVARAKALATVLSKAKVVDSKGKTVDVSAFTSAIVGPEGGDIVTADDLRGGDHEGHDHDDHEGHSH